MRVEGVVVQQVHREMEIQVVRVVKLALEQTLRRAHLLRFKLTVVRVEVAGLKSVPTLREHSAVEVEVLG